MKRIIIIAKFLLAGATATLAQSVGINSTGSQPNASAILDVSSTTKGLLLPRMTAAQRTAIAAPATGLQVYQTDGIAGFYYYNGSVWSPIAGGAQGALPGWGTMGNASIDPAANFIGTTDAQPFIGKANGEQVFRFSSTISSTVIGYQASHANIAGGTYNHFIGYKAGYNNTGVDNHFDGYMSGFSNTTGTENYFSGASSGYSNTTGNSNQFTGHNVGAFNTTGSQNFFSGNGAGFFNSTGSGNQFEGFEAGRSNNTGSNNYFSGYQAGHSNAGTSNNHFSGYQSGYSNTTGSGNYFSGYQSGYSNISGVNNFFVGYKSGYASNTGSNNYFSGNNAGKANTSGDYNSFAGNFAGVGNTTGSSNVFLGYNAGAANYAGNNNVYIGYLAGFSSTFGNSNIFIGNSAGAGETGSQKLYIGPSIGGGSHPMIYGEFDNKLLEINGSQTINGTQQIIAASSSQSPQLSITAYGGQDSKIDFRSVNSPSESWLMNAQPYVGFAFRHNGKELFSFLANGNLVVDDYVIELSDKTLKKNIVPLKNSLQKLVKLNGYTYNWIDGTKSKDLQIGLIAQEVETEFPQLVNTDKDGIKGVAYTHMVPVLVESIKEQQSMINDLRSENAQLKKDMIAIRAKLGL